LSSGSQARADWRVLVSAAFIGSGFGLAVGGLYLAGGMGRAVIEHVRAAQTAEVAMALRGPLDAAAMQAFVAAPAALAQAGGVGSEAERLASVRASRARELNCLAQAVYFEARGESVRGQAAVATVIMNRVKNPSFPKTVCGVVYQGASHRNGCQFSFACDGAAERVVELTAWTRARTVAARVLSGAVLRDVGSATHFHTTAVDPEWGSRMLRVAQVGLHVFYRRNPHAPAPKLDDQDDDAPQFVGRPAPAQPDLRLAAAIVSPADASAVKPAVVPTAEARPAAKLDPVVKPVVASPGPIARSDGQAAVRIEVSAPS
jgi:spore germination cell wall hydrolase CwlJ-like protein